MVDRNAMVQKLTEVLRANGVPEHALPKAVQHTLEAIINQGINDEVARLIDRRFNKLRNNRSLDKVIDTKIADAVERHFAPSVMREYVTKEAERVAGKLYDFIMKRGD